MPSDSTRAMRVLVADDNRDMADSLALLVKLWGYNAVVAYDGLTALQAAVAQQPNVVLLDIGMSGMNGCEVARRLRQTPGLAKVLLVAVTGYAGQKEIEQVRQAGFDHHLVKPCNLEQVRQILAQGVDRVPCEQP